MRNPLFIFSTLLLTILGLTGIRAQVTVPAAGLTASGNGGSISYSVGQVVYTSNTGTSGTVTQGVQQPYDISVVTGIETETVELTFSAYPNPTADYLTLTISSFESLDDQTDCSDLSFQLFDINGKLLQDEKITCMITSISMNDLLPSTYFLRIVRKNIEVKTFKISKR